MSMEAKRSHRPRRRRGGCCLGCIAVLVLLPLLAVALVILPPFASHSSARSTLEAKYPPGGEMVEAGEKRFHLECMGEGSPTAVIVADFIVPYHWQEVQELLSAHTRVCSYDRLGMLYSDPTFAPRTVGNVVNELDGLIRAAELGPKVILLGDGGGAVLARAYARTHPDETAGVVVLKEIYGNKDLNGYLIGLGISTLAAMPLFSTNYLINRETYFDRNIPPPCDPWMDDETCSRRRDWYMDPMTTLTYALEQVAVGLASKESQAVDINYGDVPLIVVASEDPTSTSDQLQTTYGSLAARSNRGEVVICPTVEGTTLVSEAECIVQAVVTLLPE